MVRFHLQFCVLVTASLSQSSSSENERHMYSPCSEAMNYALERLSDIEVDGLPKFKTHIAFVPCDSGVKSNRTKSGSSFKPDIAVMSIDSAYELHKLEEPDRPKLSNLITRVSEKESTGKFSWTTVLSAVEVKRKKDARWPELKRFYHQEEQVSVVRDTDKPLDEEPDDSQPPICKIMNFVRVYMLTTAVQQRLQCHWDHLSGLRTPQGWIPVQ